MTLLARQRAFLLIALKYRPKKVDSLLPFLMASEAEAVKDLYQNIRERHESEITTAAQSELKKIARTQHQTYLSEVHNDWVLQALRDEPASVVAVVLRNLPADRAAFLLEKLPFETLRHMPRLSDSFSVDARLVDLLRQRFESQFELDFVLSPGQNFEFEHVALLRAVQIEKLFLELGYHEIALGLATLPSTTQKMVLRRLDADDKARVEMDLKKITNPSAQRVKKAQVHLVSKEVEASGPDSFVREIGYLIYAKALLPRDQNRLFMIKRKMAMNEAVLLQNFIDQYSKHNTEGNVLPYREDVLMAVKSILTNKATDVEV